MINQSATAELTEDYLERLPGLRLDPDRPAAFSGWEFRSPEHIDLLFDGARA